MNLNSPYVKYGIIAAIGLVILYALMKGGSNSSSGPSGGAVAVDVNYAAQNDPAELASRASAFSEIAGLFGLAMTQESELKQAFLAHGTARRIAADEEATARAIAADETETARMGLSVATQIEGLRLRGARELAEYQASQVNYLAESFRNKGLDRQQTVLNALTSIWGTQPVFAPERRSATADIIGSISNAVSSVFGGRGR